MLPPAANDTVQHWAKTAQTDHAILTFDIETGTRVASKVGNLPSKVGHDRPLGSRIIRYVHDGRTDENIIVLTTVSTSSNMRTVSRPGNAAVSNALHKTAIAIVLIGTVDIAARQTLLQQP